MPTIKCEFCGHEQDPEVSRICDKCGKRLGRTRIDLEPNPEIKKKAELDPVRCHNCGAQTRGSVCGNCGAMVRRED